MSGATSRPIGDELLVGKPAPGQIAARAVAAARGFERERRLRRMVVIGGGWVAAGMMTLVAGGALTALIVRPAAKDRIHVAIMHDDGTYDAPATIDDLPPNRRDMAFRHTVIAYVQARENYSYEGVNASYRVASILSAPQERERYQAVMLNKRHPANPIVMYGDGVSAAMAEVDGIAVTLDDAAPNTVKAIFWVRIVAANQPVRAVRKTATMTWMPADDQIPIDLQQRYDPLGIAFTHYISTPDPDAVK